MLRNLFIVGILGMVSISSLLATGCSTGPGPQPYSVTGERPKSYSDQVAENRARAKGEITMPSLGR
jgi:hypothetical protein